MVGVDQRWSLWMMARRRVHNSLLRGFVCLIVGGNGNWDVGQNNTINGTVVWLLNRLPRFRTPSQNGSARSESNWSFNPNNLFTDFNWKYRTGEIARPSFPCVTSKMGCWFWEGDCGSEQKRWTGWLSSLGSTFSHCPIVSEWETQMASYSSDSNHWCVAQHQ